MADDAAAPNGELNEHAPVRTEQANASASELTKDIDTSVGPEDSVHSDAGVDQKLDEEDTQDAAAKPPMSHVREATLVGVFVVLALTGLFGWLGIRTYQSQLAENQNEMMLQVGRQGALNIWTINFERADTDVQRILDSSTGSFYDDFQSRLPGFTDVVKQAQVKSEAEVKEAGVESRNGDTADIIVTLAVKSSNAAAVEASSKSIRMRVTVVKTGPDEAKVSNVGFVP